MTMLPWALQVSVLWRKELALEAAERTRMRALLPFSLLVLLLFSFAVGPESRLLSRLSAGFLWLAMLFSTVLCLGESMHVERENGSIEGLRLLGVRPSALFVAKALGNAFFVALLGLVLLPASIALFDASVVLGVAPLGGIVVLGSLALCAPGTLFAALASEARAKDLLLPLLMFPLLVPCLLASVRATQLVMLGDPMGELSLWIWLLVMFNGLYWPLCAALFASVLEP